MANKKIIDLNKSSKKPTKEKTTKSSSNVEGVLGNSAGLFRITAKNFLALPSIARDIKAASQGLSQLIRIKGGSPSKGADATFLKSRDLDAKLQSQIAKQIKPSPEESSSFLDAAQTVYDIGKKIFDYGKWIWGFLSDTAIPWITGVLETTIGGVSVGTILGIVAIVTAIVGAIQQTFTDWESGKLNTMRDLSEAMLTGALNWLTLGFFGAETIREYVKIVMDISPFWNTIEKFPQLIMDLSVYLSNRIGEISNYLFDTKLETNLQPPKVENLRHLVEFIQKGLSLVTATKEERKSAESALRASMAKGEKPKPTKPVIPTPAPAAAPAVPTPTPTVPTPAPAPAVAAAPSAPTPTKGVVGTIIDSLKEAGVASEKAISNVLATVKAESNFRPRSENLNYSSAERIQQVFGKRRIPTLEFAQQFVNNPEALANEVYKTTDGNKEPGDGWKFRGRGFLQHTGRNQYEAIKKFTGIDVVSNPDLLNDLSVAAKAIPWFFLSYKRKKPEQLENMTEVNKAVAFADTTGREAEHRIASAEQIRSTLSSGQSIETLSTQVASGQRKSQKPSTPMVADVSTTIIQNTQRNQTIINNPNKNAGSEMARARTA